VRKAIAVSDNNTGSTYSLEKTDKNTSLQTTAETCVPTVSYVHFVMCCHECLPE